MSFENGDWVALSKVWLIASWLHYGVVALWGSTNPYPHTPMNASGPDVDETPVNVNGANVGES